jgi:hypothetical protein
LALNPFLPGFVMIKFELSNAQIPEKRQLFGLKSFRQANAPTNWSASHRLAFDEVKSALFFKRLAEVWRRSLQGLKRGERE